MWILMDKYVAFHLNVGFAKNTVPLVSSVISWTWFHVASMNFTTVDWLCIPDLGVQTRSRMNNNNKSVNFVENDAITLHLMRRLGRT